MSKVDELERAVRSLSPDDLRRFRECFVEFDAELWDKQIERDASEGRLDSFAEEALAAHREGRTRPL